MIQQVQLYNDQLEFDENNAKGPFGDYANTKNTYKNIGEPSFDFLVHQYIHRLVLALVLYRALNLLKLR